jgi:peptidyl-prolyl cis-trans isomerase B (cyclophilin B)
VATSSTRQRKLARAKLDRQLARRAEQERRKRQIRAAVAGVATLAVAVVGGLWIGGVFDKKSQTPAANDCSWNVQNTSANPNLKDVETPRTTGITSTGTSVMTIQLATGSITATLDRGQAKCAAESLAYLASKSFFANTKCHELINGTGGQFALRCGDPSGSGNGGAAYTWVPENVPPKATPEPSASATAAASPAASAAASPTASASPGAETIRYPKGTIAMQPGITGSQFLIFFKNSPAPDLDYSIVGQVTGGWDVIDKIVAAGVGENNKPKDEVTIQSLSVVDATEPSAEPQPSTQPSTQPSPSATPSS